MTQEEKELLLKEFSARLLYGVKFNYGGYDGCDYKVEIITSTFINNFPIENCKPYLRSMSSMTEEEYVYFTSIRGMNLRSIQEMMSENFSHPNRIAIVNTLGKYSHNIDWLNENMFDYRGLIEKGLAIEAPEGMYNIKEQ